MVFGSKKKVSTKLTDEEKFAVRILRKAQEKYNRTGNHLDLLAGMNLIKDLPSDVQEKAMRIASQQHAGGVEVERKVGNRKARIDRGQIIGVSRADEVRKANPTAVVVQLTICGSGYGEWRTDKEMITFVPRVKDASGLGWNKITSGVTCYRRDGDNGPELMFAGPGGGGTTGFSPAGALDRGSNSIDAIVGEAPTQVTNVIESEDPTDSAPIKLMIQAHSRGSVAANEVANILKAKYKQRITVELVVHDPVMGPSQKGTKLKTDVGRVDETTLIMSMNPGYGFIGNDLFTSQRVYGAKRIILSKQSHSAGLAEGFIYKGKRYEGFGLTDLDPGIYIDWNDTADSSKPLELVASLEAFRSAISDAADRDEVDEIQAKAIDDAKDRLRAVKKDAGGVSTDRRMHIINKVLVDYFS
jgi:hypothetical protein